MKSKPEKDSDDSSSDSDQSNGVVEKKEEALSNHAALELNVNGLLLTLVGPKVQEQYTLLQAYTFEALGRGLYVHGSEGGDDLREILQVRNI